MDSFLRPEARATLWRWREVAFAGLAGLLGLFWALTSFGILQWLGVGLVILALATGFAAVQRLRFAQGGGGQGVVQIDEARVTYLGPFGGGTVDLGDLARLDLDGASTPPHWWLVAGDGTMTAVPIDAEGADGLFEAFTALPGLSPAGLVEAASAPKPRRVTLWTRPKVIGQTPPSH